MSRYLVVVEKTGTGYSAYSPDVPGCIATGRTRRAVEKTMREAIEFHIQGLREDGAALPSARSYATWCEAAV